MREAAGASISALAGFRVFDQAPFGDPRWRDVANDHAAGCTAETILTTTDLSKAGRLIRA